MSTPVTGRRALLAGGAAPALARPALAGQVVLRIGDQRGGAQPLMQAAGVLTGLP